MGHIFFLLLLVVANFGFYRAREGEQRVLFRNQGHPSLLSLGSIVSTITLTSVIRCALLHNVKELDSLLLALDDLDVVSLVVGSLRMTIVVCSTEENSHC